MGFNAYLKSLRVTAAMRRLAFTNKGMQEIALGCGFESVRTFNRAFSEETGISPSEYRRALRKVQEVEETMAQVGTQTNPPCSRFLHCMGDYSTADYLFSAGSSS
jgi:AraC-like DNA-binding protein